MKTHLSARQRRRAASRARRRAPASAPAAAPWPRGSGDGLALLLVVPLAIVVLAPGWFFGHDNMHLIRLFEQDVIIRAGHFPVRWYPDVAGGYGSPHPEFYAPLFYLLAQVFYFLGIPLTVSLKLSVVGILAVSSVAMYRLAREFLGEGPAVVCAALYSFAPYHMLDLFVRTAFSELTVFAFLPIVLLAFHRLSARVTAPRVAAAAAALGALCLAHTITLMLVPPLVGGWILLLGWRIRFRRSFILASLAAGCLGVCLAAFFIIPLVLEKRFVNTEIYAEAYFDYRKHFVAPFQLVYSPWGYGLSREGTADGISFRLGLLEIAGCAAAAFWWRSLRERLPRAVPILLFATAVSAGGVFMSLSASRPVWAMIPPLRFVQFPWRFLMLPAFGMPLVAAAAAALYAGRRSAVPGRAEGKAAAPPASGLMSRRAAALVCAAVVVMSAGMFGFRRRIPPERIGFGGEHTDMRVRKAEDAAARPTVFSREFVRNETLHWFDHLPPGGYPYPPRRDLQRPKAEIARGTGEVSMEEERPLRYRMRVNAASPVTLRLNVYRFPGWRFTVDGRPAETGPMLSRRPVLSLEVPAGEHEVVATFERTPARRAGDAISLAALLGVLGLWASGALRRKPSPTD